MHHDHNHEHQHDNDTDEKRLAILLRHWVDHNHSHGEEFTRWAERARGQGMDSTAEKIEQAASQLNLASDILIGALEELNED